MKRPDLSSNPYPRKHVGSFCVIFFLAVFRPAAIWPEAPVSTAPLAVLAAWLLLFYKIQKTVGYKAFLTKHRTLLLLITGYFALCGLSLITNQHRYTDLVSFVRWGLTFPIIQSALVACGFLFTLPQNQAGLSISRLSASGILVLFIAGLIPAVALWQIINSESAYLLYQYTVAGDMGNVVGVTRGILATSTDLGAVSAIIALVALMLAIQTASHQRWLLSSLMLVIFIANAAAGTLSESRGFFLSLGIGLIILAYQLLGRNIKLIIIWALPLLLSGFLVLLFAPERMLYTVAALSPVFAALSTGIIPTEQDFVLNQMGRALGDRADLWQRAIGEITAHPWLGISNGGYRLLNESLGETPIDNVHNAYLQLGVDAGLPGFILAAMIALALLKKAKGTAQSPLYATICASLLVDNFADHSLAWIAIVTYAASSTRDSVPVLFNVQQKPSQIVAAAAISSIALGSVFVAHQQNKQKAYNAMDLAQQISSVRPYLSSDYWNSAPTLISNNMDRALRQQGEARVRGATALYPSIETARYCAYAYPNAKLLYLNNEHNAVSTSNSRMMGSRWRLSYETSPNNDCELSDATKISNWISNYHVFYGERLRNPNIDILMVTDYIAFFSPIFPASTSHELTLNLTSTALDDASATLGVYYYDATTGFLLSAFQHYPDTGASQLSVELPAAPSGKSFLKLKLENWRNDPEKKLQQEIRIKNISLKRPL